MNPFYTLVADRAAHRCEYCHAPELVFNFPFEGCVCNSDIPIEKHREVTRGVFPLLSLIYQMQEALIPLRVPTQHPVRAGKHCSISGQTHCLALTASAACEHNQSNSGYPPAIQVHLLGAFHQSAQPAQKYDAAKQIVRVQSRVEGVLRLIPVHAPVRR